MYIYENFFYSGPFYFVCTLILRGKNRCWLQFTCNGQSPRTCSLNSFGDFRRNCIWWIIEVLQYSLNSMTVLQPLFSCGRSHADYLYIYIGLHLDQNYSFSSELPCASKSIQFWPNIYFSPLWGPLHMDFYKMAIQWNPGKSEKI